MTQIDPTMVLACKVCRHRPPEDSTMEAMLLHSQVEHDTDEVRLDLLVVCSCGASMVFGQSTVYDHGVYLDSFLCPHDGNRATVRRKPGELPS